MFKKGVILKEIVSFRIRGTLKRQHSDSGMKRMQLRKETQHSQDSCEGRGLSISCHSPVFL